MYLINQKIDENGDRFYIAFLNPYFLGDTVAYGKSAIEALQNLKKHLYN